MVRSLERPQLGVVLDPLALLALAAHAGGVHEHERAVVLSSTVSTRRASFPGMSETISPLLAEQRVEEAGLADVRPAEHRNADRLVRHRLAAPRREPLEPPRRAGLLCRGREAPEISIGLAEAERRELVRQLGPRRIVELVRDEQHGLARSAQNVRQLGVARRQAGVGVDEEEDEVSLLDRSPGPGRQPRA